MGDFKDQLKRVSSPDAPDRCQGMDSKGQCILVKVEGSNFCPIHGGNKAVESAGKKEANQYRLSLYKARLKDFTEDDRLKSLRDEIGILRIIVEETMNRCSSAEDLMRRGGFLSDTIVKIEKLVASAHKLETSLGRMLDKNAALTFAQAMVEIIANAVDAAITEQKLTGGDVEDIFRHKMIDKITEEMVKTLGKMGSSES